MPELLAALSLGTDLGIASPDAHFDSRTQDVPFVKG